MTRMKQITTLPAPAKKIVYSTTDGRQRFPDILQDIYGGKAVIGFDRYGRVLGAVVPMEAVAMLAGQTEHVDDYTRGRIELAAQQLMKKTRDSAAELVDIDTIDAKRNSAKSRSIPKETTKRKRRAA